MAKSNFSPIRMPTKRPVSGKDINRVQDAIDSSMKDLAGKSGGQKITSRDGSVTIHPSSGINPSGAVDLSVPELSLIAPGTTSFSLANVAPFALTSPNPAGFIEVEIDGSTYCFPVWKKFVSSGGPPGAGLQLFVAGDAGVTIASGSITNWADQSGNGNDLVTNVNAPVYNGTGLAGVPAAQFAHAGDLSLKCHTFPWNTTGWSVFVVWKQAAPDFGRLVDWNYPADNVGIIVAGSYNDGWSSYGGVVGGSINCYVTTWTFAGGAKSYLNSFASPIATDPGTAGHTMHAGVNLGGLPGFSQGTTCLVSEFGIYDHELGSPELAQLGAYFHARGYV